MHIDDQYNYDDNFVRMVTIALCKVFGTKIRWINRWSDGKKIRVLIPFYTSFAGQERFMLDAFVDDTVSTRVELNTDQKQRGIITFKGGSQRDDEFANPNQYLSKETKINDEFRAIVSRTKAVPVNLTFDLQIRLDNEWEVDTCYTKILDVLYNYRFFNISYFGLKIDAFFKLPSDTGIEIPREITLTSDNTITMKFSIEVQTYYPVFDIMSDDLEVCDNDNQIDWDFIGIPRPKETDLTKLTESELILLAIEMNVITGITTSEYNDQISLGYETEYNNQLLSDFGYTYDSLLEILNEMNYKQLNSDGQLKRTYFYHNLIDNRSKDDIIREKLENKNKNQNNME